MVDYMVEIHASKFLSPASLYLAVALLDRFASLKLQEIDHIDRLVLARLHKRLDLRLVGPNGIFHFHITSS